MTQLGKFEKYLIEEFFDDYRSGAMSQHTFTRRVAFITGSMAAASAAMLLVGCTPEEVPRSTDPMPTPTSSAPGSGTASAGAVPGAKSPLSVPEGAAGLTTATVQFASGGTDISGYLARPEPWGRRAGRAGLPREPRADTAYPGCGAPLRQSRIRRTGPGPAEQGRRYRRYGPGRRPGSADPGRAQRHVSDFTAGFDYLNAQDFVDHGRIAMNGFCFGGGITWQSATAIPGLLATSAFYGPAPDLDKVPAIKAAVFGVYAELDQRITGAMPALRDALAKTDVRNELKIYPGVDHAFHNDTGPRYNQEQATAAWNDTLAWFGNYV